MSGKKQKKKNKEAKEAIDISANNQEENAEHLTGRVAEQITDLFWKQ